MKLWTVEEICEITDFGKSKVRSAIKSGELGSRMIGGSRRVNHQQLIEWLGCDPLAGATLTITKTVKRKDQTITKTTRVERENQLPLFKIS